MCALLKRIDTLGTQHVYTVYLILLLTFVGVATCLPRVSRDENILLNFRLNLHYVSRARLTAPVPATVWLSLIIEHKEVVIEPVGRIVADDGRLALAVEVFNCHEENTIILTLFSCSSFLTKLGCPFCT